MQPAIINIDQVFNRAQANPLPEFTDILEIQLKIVFIPLNQYLFPLNGNSTRATNQKEKRTNTDAI